MNGDNAQAVDVSMKAVKITDEIHSLFFGVYMDFTKDAEHLFNLMSSHFASDRHKILWIKNALEKAYKKGAWDREEELERMVKSSNEMRREFGDR